jgi:general secretion pathway protein A
MYESFYGLKEKPFSMLPDPAYLYLSKQHGTAMTLLEYGLENRAGFCVISGKAGTGKTTLLRRLLNRAGDDVRIGLISNTHPSFGELLRWILLAFELEDSGKTRAERHRIFTDYLIGQYAQGRRTLLIVDEAQNLSPDTLEELRMLSNINSGKDLLLQVILVGQPALRELLRRPGLEQLAQRIAVDCHLDALGREQTLRYIRHRLAVAGGESELFTRDAGEAVFDYSGGIPRLINLLCDYALVYAYAEHAAVVTGELVEQVVRQREAHGALPVFTRAAAASGRQASPAPSDRLARAADKAGVDVTPPDAGTALSRPANAKNGENARTVPASPAASPRMRARTPDAPARHATSARARPASPSRAARGKTPRAPTRGAKRAMRAASAVRRPDVHALSPARRRYVSAAAVIGLLSSLAFVWHVFSPQSAQALIAAIEGSLIPVTAATPANESGSHAMAPDKPSVTPAADTESAVSAEMRSEETR